MHAQYQQHSMIQEKWKVTWYLILRLQIVKILLNEKEDAHQVRAYSFLL
jgi:hypothetical protein